MSASKVAKLIALLLALGTTGYLTYRIMVQIRSEIEETVKEMT